ncbi:hypothetical protein [Alteribacillus sp. YIM 98480]|uniref:hypothetical protein n=1 Tax=Alteribacillus sp. YIM 98480 TaxID=2606599 RepID=UPI00131A7FD5|nr:hypothetical protein [Alteribacillus sp. YIM 98480]
MDKKKTTDRRNPETEKVNIQEMGSQNTNPVEEDYSLQNDTFAPGENRYLNEYPDTEEEDTNTEERAFSEELSDGGERDEIANRQKDRYSGGL